MKHKTAILALFLICAISAFAQSEAVAVVVHHANAANNITLPQLREYFSCERTSWPTGQKVAVFSRMPGTTEHDAMLHMIYRMTLADYKQLWVMKQMQGEASCRVTELPSRGMLMEALRTYSGAVALMRLSDVTPDLKIIAVSGKKPTDPGYPLR